MKKLSVILMTMFLLLIIVPSQMKAGTETNQAAMDAKKTAESAQANVLLSRLDVINKMDKSTLNSSEKKQLRNEVSSIKGQLKELGGGIYLSVGAIIIIILLLILLL